MIAISVAESPSNGMGVLGLDASSSLLLRYCYTAAALLLRAYYDDEDLARLSLN